MSSDKADIQSILTALEAIRNELQGLEQRVADMEVGPTDPDLALALSAAIAAYLGEKPHIRQIRLVSGVPWVHQGRATIQASHALIHETTRRSP